MHSTWKGGEDNFSSGAVPRSKILSPGRSCRPPRDNTDTVRTRGPQRSMRTRQLRPSVFSAARTCSVIANHSLCVPCAQLIRAHDIPPATRASTSAPSLPASSGSVTITRVPLPTGAGPKSCRVFRSSNLLPS